MIASQLALDEIYDAVDLPPLAVGEGADEEECEEGEESEEGESLS